MKEFWLTLYSYWCVMLKNRALAYKGLNPIVYLRNLAGDLGFEPRNAGIKIRCLRPTWRIPNNKSLLFYQLNYCSWFLVLTTGWLRTSKRNLNMAPRSGIEPELTSSKPVVLPLHHQGTEISRRACTLSFLIRLKYMNLIRVFGLHGRIRTYSLLTPDQAVYQIDITQR